MALVKRAALRARNAVQFATVRSWASSAKAADISTLTRAKRAPIVDADLVEAASREVVDFIHSTFGSVPNWLMTSVAVGHSRRGDSFAVQMAQSAAKRLGSTYVQVFEHRFVSGSSHPKQNALLPPLQIKERPTLPVLVVDDVATSGWHMEEALNAIRAFGVPAFGVAWIGGCVTRA